MLADAIRNNRRTATATDEEIKEQVQLYLHGAADRCGGKVERMKRARERKRKERVERINFTDDVESSD
jgi:hypothetical protein